MLKYDNSMDFCGCQTVWHTLNSGEIRLRGNQHEVAVQDGGGQAARQARGDSAQQEEGMLQGEVPGGLAAARFAKHPDLPTEDDQHRPRLSQLPWKNDKLFPFGRSKVLEVAHQPRRMGRGIEESREEDHCSCDGFGGERLPDPEGTTTAS